MDVKEAMDSSLRRIIPVYISQNEKITATYRTDPDERMQFVGPSWLGYRLQTKAVCNKRNKPVADGIEFISF
jgi:hypothetical protein